MSWPALAAARRRDTKARLPFLIGGCVVGSVDRAHLPALAAWPQWIDSGPDSVALVAEDRDAALAHINAALREQGLVRGWREECVAITDPAAGHTTSAISSARNNDSSSPTSSATNSVTNSATTSQPLARTERAAARFWGTLTLGAHATGYVAGARGRPTHVWIARRALTKATDPGLLDNLIGGGVPDGQSPHDTLLREGWEEAGLSPAQLAAARPGRVIRLHRDIPEGLQLEDLHTYDLPLPSATEARNQDGEVASFECLPVAQALACAAGPQMTVDAALVMLDFALRHRLLDAAQATVLELASAHLWLAPR